MDAADLNNRFTFHASSRKAHAVEHDQVREACGSAAETIDSAAPDGREKSIAITKLEEAMFWANAAIARAAP